MGFLLIAWHKRELCLLFKERSATNGVSVSLPGTGFVYIMVREDENKIDSQMRSFINYKHTHKILLLLIAALLFAMSFSVTASGKFNTHHRYLYVQPGQDIFGIVKVLYPEQRSQWPFIIKKTVKLNPHAFIGADASRIEVGQRILLPRMMGARLTSAASAKAMVYSGPKAVGQVVQSRGKTFALSNKKNKRNVSIGSEVFVGDRIYTGLNGFVRLSMIDDAKIDLRCNSEMLIEDYQLLKGANRSVLHLIKGSVNKITGSIGKVAEDIYEMHTPLATVGVRGTEYAIRVLQSHGCDGSLDVNSRGMFVKVSKGVVDIKQEKKVVALNKGNVVYMESKEASIKKIDVREGVFESAEQDKRNFIGTIYYSILFIPLIISLRLMRCNVS